MDLNVASDRPRPKMALVEDPLHVRFGDAYRRSRERARAATAVSRRSAARRSGPVPRN
jgi:hypothetical protein